MRLPRPSAGIVVTLGWVAALGYTLLLSRAGARWPGLPQLAPQGLIHPVVALLIWAVGTPVIFWSARRFPISARRWVAPAAVHFGFAAIFILALNVGVHFLADLALGRGPSVASAWRSGAYDFVRLFHLAIVVYAFLVGIGHYLGAAEARRAELLRAERLRADLAEAELRALRLQLQPHFLFNALNAIGSLILTKRAAEAHDAIGQLGDLLRGVLATERRGEVSLREELDLTEAYVALERTRLGDRLSTKWEIAPTAHAGMVPPMLLQPLVENAIRHGIASSANGGRLVVRAERVGDRLRLEVWDDGPGPTGSETSAEREGIGLENTRRRLSHQYGADHRLEFIRQDGWTRVLVDVPFRPAA
ncbi:MAG: histidine kinase [Gemmatimonadales bacterium]|nr:histidine kinase [Gemmatimonadales bacterium]